MTAVEFLAERYDYITWMRNRDEISAGTADEWRAKFVKEAKKMEEQQLNKAWQEGAVTAQNDAAKEIEPKRQGKKLPIHNVSNNEVALKAFVEEFVEAWDDGMGGDTDLYRKAKSLL